MDLIRREHDLKELQEAMQCNDAERIKDILSRIDGDSLKEMIRMFEIDLLSDACDAKSLSVILKHVDESSRLDILLYKDSIHILFRNLRNRKIADVLKVTQAIHECLKEDEWLTLLKTPTRYGYTILGEWHLRMSDRTRDSHKTKVGDEFVEDSALLFILESIRNKTELVRLLQTPYQSCLASRLIDHREILELVVNRIPKPYRLSLFQTPYPKSKRVHITSATVYLLDQNVRIPQTGYSEIEESTIIHQFTQELHYSDGFKDTRYFYSKEKHWQETNIVYILNSIDEMERFELLSTPDAKGNTPLHQLTSTQILLCILKFLPSDTGKIKQLLLAKNHLGDTPFHKGDIHGAGLPSIIGIAELIGIDVMCDVWSVQNNKGNTILHQYIQGPDVGVPRTNEHIVIQLLRFLINRLRAEDKSAFLLLANRKKQNLLHVLLDLGRFDADSGRARVPPMLDFLEAVNDTRICHQLLTQQDLYGEPPLHIISKNYPHQVLKIMRIDKCLQDTLTIINRQGDTPLHTLAQHSPNALPEVLDLILQASDILRLLETKNSSGDTVLHLAAKHAAHHCDVQLVLDVLLKKTENDAQHLLKVLRTKNRLHATPLHTALANNNCRAFQNMVKTVGDMNSLNILGVDIEPRLWDELNSERSSSALESYLQDSLSSECYYLSNVINAFNGGQAGCYLAELSAAKEETEIGEGDVLSSFKSE